MSTIPSIISDLKYGRSTLLKAIEGLSKRELTEIPIYDNNWTIKDVLAHIIGWDHRVIKALPLILQDRAGDVPSVDVQKHNEQSVAASSNISFADVMAGVKSA